MLPLSGRTLGPKMLPLRPHPPPATPVPLWSPCPNSRAASPGIRRRAGLAQGSGEGRTSKSLPTSLQSLRSRPSQRHVRGMEQRFAQFLSRIAGLRASSGLGDAMSDDAARSSAPRACHWLHPRAGVLRSRSPEEPDSRFIPALGAEGGPQPPRNPPPPNLTPACRPPPAPGRPALASARVPPPSAIPPPESPATYPPGSPP